MCDVLAFAGLAQPVALDGPRQDDGGRSFVLDRGFIGGVNLLGVVPAQSHLAKLFVRQVLHHFEQARVNTKEVLAEIAAGFDDVLLPLSVHDLA